MYLYLRNRSSVETSEKREDEKKDRMSHQKGEKTEKEIKEKKEIDGRKGSHGHLGISESHGKEKRGQFVENATLLHGYPLHLVSPIPLGVLETDGFPPLPPSTLLENVMIFRAFSRAHFVASSSPIPKPIPFHSLKRSLSQSTYDETELKMEKSSKRRRK